MIVRIFILCLIVVACNQTGKNRAISKGNIDSLTRYMNHKVLRYWSMGLWDSAHNYLNKLEDTVQELKSDRFSLNWNLQKSQQSIIEKRYDSASLFMRNALALLGTRDTNYKDSFNLYIVQQKLFMNEKLYDSALNIGNKAYYLALRHDSFAVATICLELAKMYAQIDDMPNMMKYAMIGWGFKEKEPELGSDLAHLIMYYYDRNDKLDSAIYFLKQMQSTPGLYSNQPAAIASGYESQGLLLIKKGKLQEGLPYQLEAKKILDSMGVQDSNFYNNLADTYGRLRKFEKAFMYIDSAILLAQETKDYELLSTIWRTKSDLFFKNSMYNKAYSSLDSSYAYYTEEQDSSLRKYGRDLETKYAVREKDNQIKFLAVTNAANLKIRNQQKATIISMIIAAIFLAIIGLLLWRRRQTQMLLRAENLKQQLLRVQMDPHFVFNGLSLLQCLIRDGDSEKAIDYLNNLSRLMRFNFENARENFVLLQSEIDALEAYLNLQEMYKPGLFEYHLKVYKGYEQDEIYIPLMLLQPFVENAILHGFQGIDYRGHLSIIVEKHLHSLHCIVEDNGKGFPPPSNDKRMTSTTINQERLSILEKQTGRSARLAIMDNRSSIHQAGTRVEVEIPFLPNKTGKSLND